MIAKEEKDGFLAVIRKRAPHLKCAMCGENDFILAEGYILNSVSSDLTQTIGVPILPSFGLICSNCGFISQHALGALSKMEIHKVEPNAPDNEPK